MGWLYMRDMGRFATPRAYLDDQFSYTRDDHRLAVLASSMVGTTYYAACERVEANGDRQVFAVLCLTRRSSGARDDCAFGYKEMTETMGPHESECPAAILDKLTETDSEYARAWRARCRANLASRRRANAKPVPRPGQMIIFEEALIFSDGQARDRFEVIADPKSGRPRFRDPVSRVICRVPGIKRRAYRLINRAIRISEAACD